MTRVPRDAAPVQRVGFLARVGIIVAAAVIASSCFLWWSDRRIAAWCAARSHIGPCIFPADSLVIGVLVAAAGGAIAGRILVWAIERERQLVADG